MTDHDSDAEASEWNERYADHDDSMWSGRPNGSVVAETGRMRPGRALDISCGEGADAIWLARNGWTVTATDISDTAIRRASHLADVAGAEVDFVTADVILTPPAAGAYDLIVMAYPALKREAGEAAVRTIAAAVAPEGVLLVIGHVVEPHCHGGDHADADGHHEQHGFDPADYTSIDDIIGLLGAGFAVEVDEVRERPDPPHDAQHSDDRILRVRRMR